MDFEISFDEGSLEAWHGAKFNVRTGKVSPETSWGRDQEKFEVITEGDDVYLVIP